LVSSSVAGKLANEALVGAGYMSKSRSNVRFSIYAVVSVLGGLGLVIGLLFWLDHAVKGAFLVGQHTFVLPHKQPFLTESLALAKAREALSLHVPDVSAWEVVPNPNPLARLPDGTRDRSFLRNAQNPNAGSFLFRNQPAWVEGKLVELYVSIEMSGDRIVAKVTRPK
jgi:hypothetical protein